MFKIVFHEQASSQFKIANFYKFGFHSKYNYTSNVQIWLPEVASIIASWKSIFNYKLISNLVIQKIFF